MTQDIIIWATVELFLFCIVLYLIIRANICVNNMQREVNELHMYFPATLRDIKEDFREVNRFINRKVNKIALSQQELGFLAGKLSMDLILARFSMNPFKKKMAIVSLFTKLWKMRERLRATFLKLFLK